MFWQTYTELFLFLWAVAATISAAYYHTTAQYQETMVLGAKVFIMDLILDDTVRDRARQTLGVPQTKDT